MKVTVKGTVTVTVKVSVKGTVTVTTKSYLIWQLTWRLQLKGIIASGKTDRKVFLGKHNYIDKKEH